MRPTNMVSILKLAYVPAPADSISPSFCTPNCVLWRPASPEHPPQATGGENLGEAATWDIYPRLPNWSSRARPVAAPRYLRPTLGRSRYRRPYSFPLLTDPPNTLRVSRPDP